MDMDNSKKARAVQSAAERLSNNSNDYYITSQVMKILHDLYKAGWDDAAEDTKPWEAPLAVGTLVDYHGSVEYMRGRYRITNVRTAKDLLPRMQFSDGVVYSLWKEGVPEKFGLREHSLSFVRRDSFTPVKADAYTCEMCGQTGSDAIEARIDPFLAEVHGENTLRRLCDRCWDNRKDDI